MALRRIVSDEQSEGGFALLEFDETFTDQSIEISVFNTYRIQFLGPSTPTRTIWLQQPHYFIARRTEGEGATRPRFRIGPEICDYLLPDTIIEVSSRTDRFPPKRLVWERNGVSVDVYPSSVFQGHEHQDEKTQPPIELDQPIRQMPLGQSIEVPPSRSAVAPELSLSPPSQNESEAQPSSEHPPTELNSLELTGMPPGSAASRNAEKNESQIQIFVNPPKPASPVSAGNKRKYRFFAIIFVGIGLLIFCSSYGEQIIMSIQGMASQLTNPLVGKFPEQPVGQLFSNSSDVINFQGPAGGPFEPNVSSVQLIARGGAVQWTTLNTSPAWLTVSPVEGRIRADNSVQIQIRISGGGKTRSPGMYEATVYFRRNGDDVIERRVRLIVK